MYACHFFFFKQMTAYEMRISDWSSDVCSSDLMMHIFIASTPGETPAGSCGPPVPGYEACVLDAAGLPLDSGTGRLAVRGPTGCRYLGDVRQNDYVIDGWNVTGDTYRIDEAGNFWFVDRSDDQIVSSGYNIARKSTRLNYSP